MKQNPDEAVVSSLSFSDMSDGPVHAIEKLTRRQWERLQPWLNDAGLAFYFLQKLKQADSTAVVPSSMLSRLERNFAANQARVEYMSRRFNEINKRFDDAGVSYLVVKGFSLVPEFCPYASLRYQGDLDYLVHEESLPAAQRALIDVGYSPRNSRSSKEFIFIPPGAEPSRGDEQYSPQGPHAIELHTDIWDSEVHGVQSIPALFSVDQATTRHWNGLSFPSQTDADAFLLQVMHACRHLFTQWIRVSNLLEIGYFLNRRWSDANLWNKIEERVGDNTIVREFVVIVAELASRLFAAPLPQLVQDWGPRLQPRSRVWIEHYARDWALCELPTYQFCLFPRSKLVLFLQQQYRAPSTVLEPLKNDAALSSRLSRIARSLRLRLSAFLKRVSRRRSLLVRRTVFYSLAQIRYFCEIPRWRWLTRRSRPAAKARYLLPSKNNS